MTFIGMKLQAPRTFEVVLTLILSVVFGLMAGALSAVLPIDSLMLSTLGFLATFCFGTLFAAGVDPEKYGMRAVGVYLVTGLALLFLLVSMRPDLLPAYQP